MPGAPKRRARKAALALGLPPPVPVDGLANSEREAVLAALSVAAKARPTIGAPAPALEDMTARIRTRARNLGTREQLHDFARAALVVAIEESVEMKDRIAAANALAKATEPEKQKPDESEDLLRLPAEQLAAEAAEAARVMGQQQ